MFSTFNNQIHTVVLVLLVFRIGKCNTLSFKQLWSSGRTIWNCGSYFLLLIATLNRECELSPCADPKDPVATAFHDGFEAAAVILRRRIADTTPSPQLLINMATILITLIPPSLPAFFFTRKQLTQICLVLVPSANNGEYLTLPSGASHVLQVMGVVTQRRPKSHPRLLRAVTGVSLVITLHRQQSGRGVTAEVLSTKNLPIRGDFFNGEFCLNLPSRSESCQLTVEAILVDGQRKKWRLGKEAGAVTSLNIRLENMGGGSNVGDPQRTLRDFSKPLPVQTEGVIKRSTL